MVIHIQYTKLKSRKNQDHIQKDIEENAFDAKKSVIVTVPKRSSKEGKRISAKKRAEKNRPHHPDKKIDELIRRHGEENVDIIEDSDS